MQRREFLRTATLGAGALVLGPAGAAEKAVAGNFDAFEVVELGHTGLKFPRLMMGTGVRGGMRQCNLTRMGAEKAQALLRAAYERGIRAFDLADLYGTHGFLLPALKGVKRSELCISSKIWFRGGGIPEKERPDADVVVARFLKEIGTDYLDLVQLHCVTTEKWPDELQKQEDILATLKKKGVIRAHGVSCHSLVALEAAAKTPWTDSVHTRINPFGALMDGPAGKVLPVAKEIKAAGKGLIAMKILGEGKFGKDDEKKLESLRYVLTEARADWLLVGFDAAEQVDDIAHCVRQISRV
ncbi:MAG: aldo/keto reductase [Kiritimatiellaeota bacterium]|nr:aldo/keto reductase [Kiritimatiellota bacterium]